MSRLKNKVAIVTGAASEAGIGFATARILAREGCRVVLTDLDHEGVQARAAELGQSALGLRHDVTREDDWSHVVGETVARYGAVNVLVNNAGIAVLGQAADFDYARWQRQIEVNLSSVFLGCKAVIPVFRSNGGGVIVNMSSLAGLVGITGGAAYSASKGGVRLLTKSLALELARENVRVNSVHPGLIWTDMQKVGLRESPDMVEQMTSAIPMGKMGEPDDIAGAVLFLASDESKYVTGAEIVVDGGLYAQ